MAVGSWKGYIVNCCHQSAKPEKVIFKGRTAVVFTLIPIVPNWWEEETVAPCWQEATMEGSWSAGWNEGPQPEWLVSWQPFCMSCSVTHKWSWDNEALTLPVPNFMLALWFWLQTWVLSSGLLGRKSNCTSLMDPWNQWGMSTGCGRSFWLFSFRTAPCCFLWFLHFRLRIEELQILYKKKKPPEEGKKQNVTWLETARWHPAGGAGLNSFLWL